MAIPLNHLYKSAKKEYNKNRVLERHGYRKWQKKEKLRSVNFLTTLEQKKNADNICSKSVGQMGLYVQNVAVHMRIQWQTVGTNVQIVVIKQV